MLSDRSSSFDSQFGVDTTGIIPMWRMQIDSENAKFGVQYQPTSQDELRAAVAFLGADTARFHFVDLGCGKGRALLIAAQAGFSRVTGVEFAPELARIARSNLAKMAIRNATVIDGDAAQFSFPDGPLVVYAFNPFGPQVMAQVIENLRRHADGDLYLIYSEPKHAHLMDASGFLESLGKVPGYPSVQVWQGRQQAYPNPGHDSLDDGHGRPAA